MFGKLYKASCAAASRKIGTTGLTGLTRAGTQEQFEGVYFRYKIGIIVFLGVPFYVFRSKTCIYHHFKSGQHEAKLQLRVVRAHHAVEAHLQVARAPAVVQRAKFPSKPAQKTYHSGHSRRRCECWRHQGRAPSLRIGPCAPRWRSAQRSSRESTRVRGRRSGSPLFARVIPSLPRCAARVLRLPRHAPADNEPQLSTLRAGRRHRAGLCSRTRRGRTECSWSARQQTTAAKHACTPSERVGRRQRKS